MLIVQLSLKSLSHLGIHYIANRTKKVRKYFPRIQKLLPNSAKKSLISLMTMNGLSEILTNVFVASL